MRPAPATKLLTASSSAKSGVHPEDEQLLARLASHDISIARNSLAPLRLLVPVKLGLKNIKAITRITYTKDEPPDYWAKRGYSRYDGI